MANRFERGNANIDRMEKTTKRQKQKLKLSSSKFIALVLIFIASCSFLTYIAVKYRNKSQKYKNELENIAENSFPSDNPDIEKIAEQIKPETAIDAPRKICNYISENSVLDGKEDSLDAERGIAKIAKGEKPFLLCGARAQIMKRLLDRFGLISRVVHGFDLSEEKIQSHTFVEVYNFSTNGWEVYDPYFNIYFTKDGKKQGIIQALESGFSVAFCGDSRDAQKLQWINEKFHKYSDAFIIESTDAKTGLKNPILLCGEQTNNTTASNPLPSHFSEWCMKKYGVPTMIRIKKIK
jgi:hypothetical protein